MCLSIYRSSEIDAETRMSHLRAFIALDMAGQKQEILLYNKVRTGISYLLRF